MNDNCETFTKILQNKCFLHPEYTKKYPPLSQEKDIKKVFMREIIFWVSYRLFYLHMP